MDADPTLPPAPPAVALVLLDVAIYRSQKKSKNRSIRSIDRAIGNGEEEIREDDENGKGETYWRLQPALLLSGGRRLVAGDGESRRSCGGLVQGGWRLRASVECESASVRGAWP